MKIRPQNLEFRIENLFLSMRFGENKNMGVIPIC